MVLIGEFASYHNDVMPDSLLLVSSCINSRGCLSWLTVGLPGGMCTVSLMLLGIGKGSGTLWMWSNKGGCTHQAEISIIRAVQTGLYKPKAQGLPYLRVPSHFQVPLLSSGQGIKRDDLGPLMLTTLDARWLHSLQLSPAGVQRVRV